VADSGHLFKGVLLFGVRHLNLIYVTITYGCVPVGWQLVEELKGDEALRKALSDELLIKALSRKEWRKSVLLAVAREVATRDNIRELREYIDASIRELRAYMDSRFDRLNSRVDILLVTVAATLATTLIPLILRVLSGV